MTTYQVKSAAAVVRGTDGAQHMFYEKAVFDDGNFDVEHVKMLAKEGFIEKFTSAEPEPSNEEPKPGTAAFVLKEVGDDKAKAQVALDEEKAGQKRKTLMADLEKILAG